MREAARAVLDDLAQQAKGLPGVAEAVQTILKIVGGADAEAHARLAVERLANLAAAAALAAGAPSFIAEQFAQAHLAGPRGDSYGAIVIDGTEKILARALPA